MNKSLLFALALGAVLSANAQREYQDGVYTVVGQHGNRIDVRKGNCQTQQPQFYIEDNTQCFSDYDDVIENENSVRNVLVKENETVNYYHVREVKENHFYIGNTPTRHVPVRKRYVDRRIETYAPVSSYINHSNYSPVQVDNGDKWFFFFQFNSDYLTNREELGHLIDFAKCNPFTIFYIDSYADAETGTLAQNESISKRRANTVVNYLIREGISVDRLFVNYHGCVNQPYRNNNLNRCVTVKTVNR